MSDTGDYLFREAIAQFPGDDQVALEALSKAGPEVKLNVYRATCNKIHATLTSGSYRKLRPKFLEAIEGDIIEIKKDLNNLYEKYGLKDLNKAREFMESAQIKISVALDMFDEEYESDPATRAVSSENRYKAFGKCADSIQNATRFIESAVSSAAKWS